MSQPDLQWKDIPIEPFNTSYVISNYGDIKNKKTQKIKAFQISSTGYKSVKLDTGSNKKTIDVHSYVAKAFLTPIQEKDNLKIVVSFKDGNKSNIYYKNLEYGYQKISKSAKNDIINRSNNNVITDITIGDFTGRKINGFENYLVSRDGKIFTLLRNKLLELEYAPTGYVKVRLQNNGETYIFYVHQLVAKTYIPNPNNYDKINHKDFNKHNNTIDNLEWCTDSMNMIHNAVNKPETSKKVKQINKETNEVIKVFDSIKEAAISTGSNNTAIIHCCSGKYNTANGYKWTYA
jgi:hypothetical protein